MEVSLDKAKAVRLERPSLSTDLYTLFTSLESQIDLGSRSVPVSAFVSNKNSNGNLRPASNAHTHGIDISRLFRHCSAQPLISKLNCHGALITLACECDVTHIQPVDSIEGVEKRASARGTQPREETLGWPRVAESGILMAPRPLLSSDPLDPPSCTLRGVEAIQHQRPAVLRILGILGAWNR